MLRTFRAISYEPVEADSAALVVLVDSLLSMPSDAVYEAHSEDIAVTLSHTGRTLKVKARTIAKPEGRTVTESTEYKAVIDKAEKETTEKAQPSKPRSLWSIQNISYVCVAMVVLFSILVIIHTSLKWLSSAIKKYFNMK